MMKVYVNYPNPKFSIHNDPLCAEVRKMTGAVNFRKNDLYIEPPRTRSFLTEPALSGIVLSVVERVERD